MIRVDDSGQRPGLRWNGEFRDRKLEEGFRSEQWPRLFMMLGRIALGIAVFYAAAGIGPVIEFGWVPKTLFLTGFRLFVLFLGILVFGIAKDPHRLFRFQASLVLFLLAVGIYEAVEAVLFYVPELEYYTPFTLLIIFLMYLLLPVLLAPIAIVAVFSSLLYVSSLAFFAVPVWTNCIQLSFFFLFANVLGAYIFVERAKSRRMQYFAMARIQALNARLKTEIEQKERANKSLEILSVTDALTGLPNRRKFMEIAEREVHRAKRYGPPLSPGNT